MKRQQQAYSLPPLWRGWSAGGVWGAPRRSYVLLYLRHSTIFWRNRAAALPQPTRSGVSSSLWERVRQNYRNNYFMYKQPCVMRSVPNLLKREKEKPPIFRSSKYSQKRQWRKTNGRFTNESCLRTNKNAYMRVKTSAVNPNLLTRPEAIYLSCEVFPLEN